MYSDVSLKFTVSYTPHSYETVIDKTGVTDKRYTCN